MAAVYVEKVSKSSGGGEETGSLGEKRHTETKCLRGEKHERESCAGRGEPEGALQREGAAAAGFGSLKGRAGLWR